MNAETFNLYFSYVTLFLTGKGIDIQKLQQSDIPAFVIFCQKYLSKEISDSITYQIIAEIAG